MKPDHPLLKIAQSQSGLFASQQAMEAGIDSRNHSYHLRVGNWSRVGKGIYQLNSIRENSRRDFFFFQLWARSRSGHLVGVFSFETALYLMGLEISPPVKYHITVPNNFRRSFHRTDKLILHYKDLNPLEKTMKDGLSITTGQKTFKDLISTGVSHPEWIKQQLKQALEKKLVSPEEIKKISIPDKKKRIFKAILFELFD